MRSGARVIRAVIADDEPAARAKLHRLLAAQPDITIVAEAADGIAVIDAVRRHRPDLILVDIRMPEIDGLTAVSTFDEAIRPLVVFVTAHADYAVRAFAMRALDFLLKPYDAARLAETLHRVRRSLELSQRPNVTAVHEMIARGQRVRRERNTAEASGSREYLQRLTVRLAGKLHVVPVASVEWIEANGNSVYLHGNGSSCALRNTMRRLAHQLDPSRFARIHRGALVNLEAVTSLESLTSGDGLVHMRSGTTLRMSRTFRGEVHKKLEGGTPRGTRRETLHG